MEVGLLRYILYFFLRASKQMNLTTVITIASLTLTCIAFYYLWLNQQQLALEIQQIRVNNACGSSNHNVNSVQPGTNRHLDISETESVVSPLVLQQRLQEITHAHQHVNAPTDQINSIKMTSLGSAEVNSDNDDNVESEGEYTTDDDSYTDEDTGNDSDGSHEDLNHPRHGSQRVWDQQI